MECREKQRLTEEYFDAVRRQQRIRESLKALRASGDAQLISVGEKQEEAAIEEAYEAWEALNSHYCTERCERG
jgi:hypothetical protein